MNIILISSPKNLKNEEKIIINLFENGLNFFHLRKLNYTIYDYFNLLKNIPEKYHKNIIISHFQELINDFNLKGIHFSQKERNENKHLSFKKIKCTKTTSFHLLDEINEEYWDFYYLSPFFDSISKPNYKKKEFFINDLNKKKLIALGGIYSKNINIIKEKNIENIGILGAVWNLSDDYINNFKKLYYLL